MMKATQTTFGTRPGRYDQERSFRARPTAPNPVLTTLRYFRNEYLEQS
jgi:hypothetical protein